MDDSTLEQVETQHFIDRYLMGRLSAEEEQDFVSRYMSCQETLDALERAEKMQRAIKHQAIETFESEAPEARLLGFPTPSKAGLWALAALLVLAILPTGLMQREISQLRHELDAANQAQSNVLLATLGAERSSEGEPAQHMRVGQEPHWIVLSLELELLEHDAYRATLRHERGGEVWASEDLHATPLDTLTIGFPSTALVPGDYSVEVEGLAVDGTSSFVSNFRFRVIDSGS